MFRAVKIRTALLFLFCWSIEVPAQGPTLVPREFERDMPRESSFWLRAEHILVVRVLRNEQIGAPYPIGSASELPLRLYDVTFEAENILEEGNDLGGLNHFYYFGTPLKGRHRNFRPGTRYIVFLREDNGVLRTLTDRQTYTLTVTTGKHEHEQIPPGLTTLKKIDYILWTPGTDFDPDYFVGSYVETFMWEGSWKYRLSLILQLLGNPNRSLRDHACLLLAAHYWINHTCLDSALDSPDESVQTSARRYVDSDPSFVEQLLREAPFNLSDHFGEYFAEQLEVFTYDSRPTIHKLACEKLKVLKGDQEIPTCSPQNAE